MTKVCAFDPSISKPGCAITLADESIVHISGLHTDTQATDAERITAISLWANDILLEHRPDIVAVERTFVRSKRGERHNYDSALKLAKAAGGIIAIAGLYVKPVEYLASEWQRILYAKRSFKTVKKAVEYTLNLRYGDALKEWRLSEDKRDALAIATYAVSLLRIGQLQVSTTRYPDK